MTSFIDIFLSGMIGACVFILSFQFGLGLELSAFISGVYGHIFTRFIFSLRAIMSETIDEVNGK